MDEYGKQFESEVMQFLFLADKNDRKMLLSRYKKQNMPEFVRLACLALTFGYKKLFMKIAATVQIDTDQFLSGLDIVKGNFPLYEKWVCEFISRVPDSKVKALCLELWEARKNEFDINNFSLEQLF